ncbi:MAG: hypothetical protein E6Q24_13580 [Chitinophagaceae bacterium]|jgi:hypothetical protein|nr:MAG: hypothetical protein E6Q24_13580 [Chitinophagaceae bacterium]
MTIRFLLYLILLVYLLVLGLIRFKKLTLPFQILTVLIACTLVSEIISRVLINVFKNSSPVYHVFNIVNFTGYALIYYFLLQSRLSRKVILLLIAGAVCFSVFNTIFLQSLWSFPSNFLLILCFLNIYCALLLFRQMLHDDEEIDILRQSVFWFNCAVLLFYTAIFLNWSFYNYLVRNKFNTKTISTIMYYLNIAYYIVVGISIHINNRKAVPVKQ